MITSNILGHQVVFKSPHWYFVESGKKVDNNDLPVCAKCKHPPTKEGYDPCLGHINNAISACCGHGVDKPIFLFSKQITANRGV